MNQSQRYVAGPAPIMPDIGGPSTGFVHGDPFNAAGGQAGPGARSATPTIGPQFPNQPRPIFHPTGRQGFAPPGRQSSTEPTNAYYDGNATGIEGLARLARQFPTGSANAYNGSARAGQGYATNSGFALPGGRAVETTQELPG